MSTNFRSRAAWLGLAAIAVAVFVAPAVQATPVTYDFTVNIPTGPLAGTNEKGSFSYDSSSITPGAENDTFGLLTALNFTFNGIAYNASTANTGFLTFDSAGNLTEFVFGTWCDDPGSCATGPYRNDWYATSFAGIWYGVLDSDQVFTGELTWALAPASVPEPGTLGLFGLGALVIGAFARRRRRTC